jgi:hypothetical protein
MSVKNFNLRRVALVIAVSLLIGLPAQLFLSSGLEAAGQSLAEKASQFLYRDYVENGVNNSDAGVGSYALYVLTQAGVDVSTWVYNGVSLEDAVINAVYDDISNAADPSKVSAKLLVRDLAAMKALGQSDLVSQLEQVLQSRQSRAGFDTGDYSLFSNLPAYDLLGRIGSISVINTVYAKDYILGEQNQTVSDDAYGSWGFTWDGAFYADFMATAAAVRALSYLDPDKSDASVQDAINNGLDWMKKQQQADGGFMAGMDDPAIDTAEVIITLKTLGMDPSSWKSGDDKSAVDYIMNDAPNPDGSFGASRNDMNATWALCAYNLLTVQFVQFYLDPASADLSKGNKKQFKAVWQDNCGETDVTQDAEWSVDDSNIASVDNSVYKGEVIALKTGKTVVSAVYGGIRASAALSVNSLSGGGGGGGKTVGQAIVGMSGELLFAPRNVFVPETNEWGLTVLGALDASGVDYNASIWSWGILVDSIEGQSNSGMAGWMYAVDGQIATASPDKYKIGNNDKIIWYYSTSMDQQPPKWDDLVGQTSSGGGGGQSGNLLTTVSDSTLNAAVQNAGTAGMVILQADSAQTTLALSSAQLSKIKNAGKPLSVTIQGVQFVLSTDSPQRSSADGAANTAQLQLKVVKLSSVDVQSLTESFAEKLKLVGGVYELSILAVDEDGTQQSIKQFSDCKVLLPVAEEFREAAANGEVKAYWYNETSKTWEEMGGVYDATSSAISFKADHFSKYALLQNLQQDVSLPEIKTFKDISGHWAREEIEFMASKGYVAGVGMNEFAPETVITRAEFTVILARMAGLPASPEGAERFNDVPAGAWYRGMVGAAANAKLVSGMDENNFAPNEPVTREQMAAMMVRLMVKSGLNMTIVDADTPKILNGFNDAAGISSWARSSVAMAVRDQLMAGREIERFAPLGNTTRAEATVVLYRVLQKLPQLEK